MKSRFISDPQDPSGDGVFNSAGDGVNPNFFPSSFFLAAGHDGGSPSAGISPAILPLPTPIAPVEAVQAQSAQNGPGGPGSVVAETSGGITFNLVFDAAAMAAPQSFRNGIEQAASILSATITNKITVNINIDYSGTGGGAAAGPDNGLFENYSTVKADLISNAAPGDPTFNALPTGSTIQGQSQVAVWNTQLKLWGLLGANDTTTDDGSATFATDIQSSLLVGVALHELTHALGRVPYGPPSGPQPDIFDLFRFTSPGTQLINGASTAPAAYFSVDGGNTKIADYGQTSDPSDFLNSGVQGGNDPFNEFYTSSTLQSLTAADKEQLDALGFHLASPLTTTIQTDTNSIASTSLVQFFGNYYLENASSGQGPELKLGGVPVAVGQAGAWSPIGAVQTASGYDVAWKEAGADQYAVWATDNNGNYLSTVITAESGTSLSLDQIETVFNQDLNGDGKIGVPTIVIQTDTNSFGSTSLAQVGVNYYLENAGTGQGPELKISGVAVVAGQYGAVWTPIGVVQTAGGYDVAWKDTATNQYTVWSTDSSGNYLSNAFGVVSASNTQLELFEKIFNQDLNGDGAIGPPSTTLIQTDTNSFGSTSFVQVASNYYLENTSSGVVPELQIAGAAVVAGQYGAVWVPIGAVQTATGYDVAWKDTATNQYTVWSTDSSGNYLSNAFGVVSASNTQLELFEKIFNQDLNGDGAIGPPSTTLIQTDTNSFGSTSLVQVASNYYLENTSSGVVPELQIAGAAVVAGQYGAVWAPIGAVETATGYDVAWKDTATNQYTVWSTDSNGNYISNVFGVVSGTNSALQSIETTFHQDLNGDGVIGIPTTAAPVATVKGTGPGSVAAQPHVAAAMTSGSDTFLFRAASDPVWNTVKEGNFELNPLLSAVNGDPPTAGSNETLAGQLQHLIFHTADGSHETLGNHGSTTVANVVLADLHWGHFVIS